MPARSQAGAPIVVSRSRYKTLQTSQTPDERPSQGVVMRERWAPRITQGTRTMNVNIDGGTKLATTGSLADGRSRGMRRALGGLLLASLLATGVVGVAGGHPAGHAPRDTYSQIDLKHLHAIFEHLITVVSPEQQAAMRAIGGAVHEDLQALNQQASAAHRRKVGLLLQGRIDRAALERARADEIEAAERLAERIDAVLLDLAEVMTPDQRARLRDHVKEQEG
ncbi:periplasmic heavy metal sensor [Montanilutibacter psychrotolerans]|uniref:periplasmic heavy metal sensor n=1 Tax=Montanilutibacter psychrotolerans TaxID=1327343 RepID=UPI001681B1C3|nr:periplasmic heavy metal sensor [Lysobacter psychrotolerans]